MRKREVDRGEGGSGQFQSSQQCLHLLLPRLRSPALHQGQWRHSVAAYTGCSSAPLSTSSYTPAPRDTQTPQPCAARTTSVTADLKNAFKSTFRSICYIEDIWLHKLFRYPWLTNTRQCSTSWCSTFPVTYHLCVVSGAARHRHRYGNSHRHPRGSKQCRWWN